MAHPSWASLLLCNMEMPMQYEPHRICGVKEKWASKTQYMPSQVCSGFISELFPISFTPRVISDTNRSLQNQPLATPGQTPTGSDEPPGQRDLEGPEPLTCTEPWGCVHSLCHCPFPGYTRGVSLRGRGYHGGEPSGPS